MATSLPRSQFPLRAAPEALAAIEAGHSVGKAVLEVA